MSFSSSVPRLAASCSATRPVRFSRSIASEAKLKLPFQAGQSTLPCWSRPRSSARPSTLSSVGAPFAAHQVAERELDVELVGADLAEIVGAADRDRAQPQASASATAARPARPPPAPGRRRSCVASASNCGRNWFQSMKYGPISAATSARIKAIARSEQGRLHGVSSWTSPARAAHPPPPRRSPPYIEASMAKSQQAKVTA